MAEKQIKQWGVIGGLESKSKSWTTPRAGILDMMYRREESYTETTYTDFGSAIQEIAEHYQADFGTDYVIYHEITQSFGRPFWTLSVKTGRAKKLIFDDDMRPTN